MFQSKMALKYDILLKPVHENLLKDWGLTVSLFLEDFMDHLSKQKTNFSQAALIVQNSTAFYCKRVDVVYKSIQEFVTDICSNLKDDGEIPAGQKISEGKKKRKNVKSLEMDDLQLLDFVASDHTIDAKTNVLVFQGLPKQIVLCSSVKALRKAGTSVTVYQASNATLGCKDEFRIFGKTYADGTVNEDFNFDQEQLISPVDETIVNGDDGFADNSCGGFDDIAERGNDTIQNSNHEIPVDEVPPPEYTDQPSSEVPNFSTLAVSASIPVGAERCAPARPKIRKNFEWEPVPSDFKFPSKALKMGKSVYIPSVCLDEEMLMEMEQMDVKPKKSKRKDLKEAVDGVKIRWIDEAIRVGSVDLSEVYLLKEREKRKQLLAVKRLPQVPEAHDSSVGPLDDPEQDDFEAFQDDNEVLSAAPVNRIDDVLQEDDRREYADEALKAIEKFKENRRENANRQTDIAKRVAQWHETIMPKLAEAEARSHLDVHEYGTRILDMFPDDDPNLILPFYNIVKDEPANEICRYVLAMLMLANTYNVEIIKNDIPLVNTRGMYCDNIDLRLLTKVRHHEEMDEAFRVTSGECGS